MPQLAAPASVLWPRGAGSQGSRPRCALGTSSCCAAQGPREGLRCGLDGPGRSRRSCGVYNTQAQRLPLEGTSFAPQLLPHGEAARRRGKPYALLQWHAHTRTANAARAAKASTDVQPCMGYALRTATHSVHVWRAANASVEEATHCSASRDVYELPRPGALETRNLAASSEGAALTLKMADELDGVLRRWEPQPEPGSSAHALKTHFVAWPDEAAGGNTHVFVTLECNRRQCQERERRKGAWRQGGESIRYHK